MDYIADNSVWQRLRLGEVRAQLSSLVEDAGPDAVMVCPVVVAEVGFSARSGAEHDQLVAWLASFPECSLHPSSQLVLEIQNALFNGGLLRAAGAVDTVIAAYGIANDATVLHYDRDFEHIARVRPDFKHRWIVPRGSLEG